MEVAPHPQHSMAHWHMQSFPFQWVEQASEQQRTFLGIWVPFLCFGSPFFYFRPKNSDKYGYLLSANADDWSWKIHKLFWEKSSDASSLHEWSVDIICLQMQTAGFDKCTTTQQTNLYIDSTQIQTNPWWPYLLHAYAGMSCHRDNLSYWRRWLVIIILMIKLCQNY